MTDPRLFLRGLFCENRFDWPAGDRHEEPDAGPGEGNQDAILDFLDEQDMGALVHFHMSGRPEWSSWPAKVRERLAAVEKEQKIREIYNYHEVVKVLEALNREGIHPLLFKGTALAYGAYPFWHLRPRADTDLLFPERDVSLLEGIFSKLGYTRQNEISGRMVSYQCSYSMESDHGLGHTFDCHWRISTPQLFAHLFSYEELVKRAEKAGSLSPHALSVGSVDAVLINCVHRAAHHDNEVRLLWFYDLHRLVTGRDLSWWTELAGLARAKGISTVCGEGLLEAAKWFGTSWPDSVVEKNMMGWRDQEKTARYLNGKAGLWRKLVWDLESLGGKGRKRTLLMEFLFPPAEYILAKYSVRQKSLLPFLYLRRIVSGLYKHLFFPAR